MNSEYEVLGYLHQFVYFWNFRISSLGYSQLNGSIVHVIHKIANGLVDWIIINQMSGSEQQLWEAVEICFWDFCQSMHCGVLDGLWAWLFV